MERLDRADLAEECLDQVVGPSDQEKDLRARTGKATTPQTTAGASMPPLQVSKSSVQDFQPAMATRQMSSKHLQRCVFCGTVAHALNPKP